MKRVSLIASLGLLLACGCNDKPSSRSNSTSEFQASAGPFLSTGALPWQLQTHVFEVRNPSTTETASLTIASRSCNCLDVKLDRPRLSPSGTSDLSITFPCHARTAIEPYSVSVDTGLEAPSRLTYTVNVRTMAILEIEPPRLALRHMPGQGSLTARFTVIRHGKMPAPATETSAAEPELVVEPSCDTLKIERGPATRLPVADAPGFYRETIACTANIEHGANDDHIRDEHVRVRAGRAVADVLLNIETTNAIRVNSETLYLHSAERQIEQRTVVLSSAQPFRVTGLDESPEWIRLRPTSSVPLCIHELAFDVDLRKVSQDFVSERIRIACEHPEQLHVDLRLLGRIGNPGIDSQ